MKIVSKILIGLAGLVGGALIERGVSGYADDISEMRHKPDGAPDDETAADDGAAAETEQEETETEAEQEESTD